MLSTITHLPPTHAYGPRDLPHTTMTTSLPILQRTPALQRPKLRLDTQQNRTFGKGSTSLRLDTLSAVSPTIRNTFSNAYEPPASSSSSTSSSPASGRPSRPRLSIDSSCDSLSSASTPSSASTLASSLTSASNDSATLVVPYKQPHNLTSILRNSPAQSILPRKMAAVRPLFPAEKTVSFRTPLEEEIKNVKYTMAHSDLESSTSTISSLALSSSESEPSEASVSIEVTSASDEHSAPSESPRSFSSLESSPRPRGPRAGDKRDSSESDSDSCPETPVAGRRKRRREWQWTLPVPAGSNKSTSSSTSDATTSNDSA
ncbi:hypothetical protein CC80DRAFT_487500 [Byssothecium circinans]|uniref:Uncharacterized protein n=1 Tax=Byssothecium circinans TaxID=147558 RepID=A0A6A5UEB4_9PLEO|nr:hypothetical protein CC80DRAFT_487500 [Byssothecium circinans]